MRITSRDREGIEKEKGISANREGRGGQSAISK